LSLLLVDFIDFCQYFVWIQQTPLFFDCGRVNYFTGTTF